MAGLQVQGASGSVAEVGAFAAEGLHTISKPQDYGALGSYAAVLTTGTIAAGMAALGELLQFRWVSSANFALVHEVQVLRFESLTGFAAGTFLFDMIRSTAWSADGSGGAAVTVTDPQMQLRPPTMGATLLSTGFRIATTAALGAGTKTLDTLPLGATYGRTGTAANQMKIPQSPVVTTAEGAAGPGITLWKNDVASGEYPLVLTSNGGSTSEGFSIRATVPATGTWVASFLVKWSEVPAF